MLGIVPWGIQQQASACLSVWTWRCTDQRHVTATALGNVFALDPLLIGNMFVVGRGRLPVEFDGAA